MKKTCHNLPGFTLVELLVVVAVIVLLISILIPSLSAAKAQTKLTVCRTNLKSMGELIQLYAQANDGRIPRGPSHDGNPNPLLHIGIATNQVWMGDDFANGFPWGGVAPGTLDVSKQYVGLGMLIKNQEIKQPNDSKDLTRGNEYLFCPADDKGNLNEEGPKLGTPGKNAYGSYFYRQLDAMPNDVYAFGGPDREGKLDDLRSNEFTNPLETEYFPENPDPTLPSGMGTVKASVEALAMDANTATQLEDYRQENHNGKRLNVLFKDGSTSTYDNEFQPLIVGGGGVAWGSIPESAFTAFPNFSQLQIHLDRIFISADVGFRNQEPWKSPFPGNPLP